MIGHVLSSSPLRLRVELSRLGHCSPRARDRVLTTFRFNGAAVQPYGGGEIELGEHTTCVGELSTVQAFAGHRVSVGRACFISHSVRGCTEGADVDSDFRAVDCRFARGGTRIGDGVWIGANAFIGPGIRVGDNSVVGANSVVTSDIPVGQIWGGVPARFIRAKRGIDKQ